MIKFINDYKLFDFCKKYLKVPYGCYDWGAVKDEVWGEACKGNHCYEISQFEAVDGCTHDLDFTVSYKDDDIIIEF